MCSFWDFIFWDFEMLIFDILRCWDFEMLRFWDFEEHGVRGPGWGTRIPRAIGAEEPGHPRTLSNTSPILCTEEVRAPKAKPNQGKTHLFFYSRFTSETRKTRSQIYVETDSQNNVFRDPKKGRMSQTISKHKFFGVAKNVVLTVGFDINLRPRFACFWGEPAIKKQMGFSLIRLCLRGPYFFCAKDWTSVAECSWMSGFLGPDGPRNPGSSAWPSDSVFLKISKS
jgi:hypothetical protein